MFRVSEVRDIEELRTARYKGKLNSIRIAVINPDKKISFSYKDFLKKYYSVNEFGYVDGTNSKEEALYKFFNKNKLQDGGNRFRVMSSEGIEFDPIDFLNFVAENNRQVDMNKTEIKRSLNPMQV